MISIQGASKKYGSVEALQAVDLKLQSGQTHVLLGSSGSGKTTLLRLISGLIDCTSGKILIDGEAVSVKMQTELALKIGYVIQEGGLFPHLSAKENVVLAARAQGWDTGRIENRLAALTELVQLNAAFLKQYPKELSGGQRQRVALMRALMLDPPILLLDEPLGALDPLVRSDLQKELKRIFNQVKKTVVMVTHDIGEGAFFGHTVSLFHEGALIQHGDFPSFVKSPKSDFVSRFIHAQISNEVLEAFR
jgi:osmoprotectant transport system ATP-binding protein